VIRTPKGNAAESIGEKLDKKIRDNIRDPRSSLYVGARAAAADGFRYSHSLYLIMKMQNNDRLNGLVPSVVPRLRVCWW
jgi:hypothetical protein